jgi:hypothetical protein
MISLSAWCATTSAAATKRMLPTVSVRAFWGMIFLSVGFIIPLVFSARKTKKKRQSAHLKRDLLWEWQRPSTLVSQNYFRNLFTIHRVISARKKRNPWFWTSLHTSGVLGELLLNVLDHEVADHLCSHE